MTIKVCKIMEENYRLIEVVNDGIVPEYFNEDNVWFIWNDEPGAYNEIYTEEEFLYYYRPVNTPLGWSVPLRVPGVEFEKFDPYFHHIPSTPDPSECSNVACRGCYLHVNVD